VVPRQIKLDPIETFNMVYQSNQFMYGVALRKSGKVDLYFNCKVTHSSEETYQYAEINFQKIILMTSDKKIFQI